MTIRDILSLRPGECKFCITDDTPFYFCGEPVVRDDDNNAISSYCPKHHIICHAGFGRDADLIAQMIDNMESTVTRARGAAPNSVPVDVAMRREK